MGPSPVPPPAAKEGWLARDRPSCALAQAQRQTTPPGSVWAAPWTQQQSLMREFQN